MKIEFNNPLFAKERSEVKELTLAEEDTVIQMLNTILIGGTVIHQDKNIIAIQDPYDMNSDVVDVMEYPANLLQRFVWNYENLNHFKSVNSILQERVNSFNQSVD